MHKYDEPKKSTVPDTTIDRLAIFLLEVSLWIREMRRGTFVREGLLLGNILGDN